MTASLTPEQIGAIAGGAVAGVAGMSAVAAWCISRLPFFKKMRDETQGPVGRGEFNQAMEIMRKDLSDAVSGLRDDISDLREETRAAHQAADKAQASVDRVAEVIQTSMSALGDRLEGALRTVTKRQDEHSTKLEDTAVRIASVETELDLTAGRPPRQH